MIVKKIGTTLLLSFAGLLLFAQSHPPFTHADTIRGTVTDERAWWNVTHYNLRVQFDYLNRTLAGNNTISFNIISSSKKNMQIDLQPGLDIDSVISAGSKLKFKRDGSAYYIQWNHHPKEQQGKVTVYYHGVPRVGKRPPWDGGVTWSADKHGNPWITVTCQGLGASVWYPCKDYQGDEPDSASLSITVPDTLVAVANGRLREQRPAAPGYSTYTWAVVNPINNYNLIPYIGKYSHWQDTFAGEKGNLDCDYWALTENLEQAKAQFVQVKAMLTCFEHWFGPYPFYEDGYKLVQAPHLGMEHQSAVAYGNGFRNGYRGTDLSETGWGLRWDFIIVHESGHEWFGNNITSNDIADMWIHESFTNYSETIFTECQFGKEAGSDYVTGTRRKIENNTPIIGHYGVNEEGSGDMYYNGGNMLHTIRQVINNDEKFREMLRSMNAHFYHKTVDGQEVRKYMSEQAGFDLSKIFQQYLETTQVPMLEYKSVQGGFDYRWTNVVKGFAMPLKVFTDKEEWIHPTEEWQTLRTPSEQLTVDRNFYVKVKAVN